MTKKVFVSGCFDMLHSGHVAFFEEASSLGDLYVGLGSDQTMALLKGRKPVNTEKERLYVLKSLKSVNHAWINSGSGMIDFEKELRDLHPDIFFVNEDGYTKDKQKLCQELGIELIVSKRMPHKGLPARSTTVLRKECLIPFRLDLAGGWLDQPFVSKYFHGPVITISIEPTIEFNDRCGMATSTRAKAIELWQTNIPEGDKEKLAHTLFCVENPPGTKYVSGSQDSIGIVFPGVNKLNYAKENYWPVSFESLTDEATLSWIENHLWFINLSLRDQCFDALSGTKIDTTGAKALADAAEALWQSILDKNLLQFGKYFRESFEAQISMFPNMVTPQITEALHQHESSALGWKISGAGGGGYLVLVSETPVENAMQIRIRR